MVDRFIHSRFQLIFLLTIFVFVCSGLQAATASVRPQENVCAPVVRTDGCHLIFIQAKPPTCCPSRACHQTTPVQRDLGRPEYHTQQKSAHPLAHESRTFSPQFKAGQAIVATYVPQNNFQSINTIQPKPLQSLTNLRSVVLLH